MHVAVTGSAGLIRVGTDPGPPCGGSPRDASNSGRRPRRCGADSTGTPDGAYSIRERSMGSKASSTWEASRWTPVGRQSTSARSVAAALIARPSWPARSSRFARCRKCSSWRPRSASMATGATRSSTSASALGSGFLADVGRAWEAAADPARNAGIRTVHTRFGIVLSRAGGALAKMLPPFELGAGGKIGPGTQWMSWVAREDAIRVIRYGLENAALSGPINVTSPSPVTNGEFAKTLGHVLRRPPVATRPGFHRRLAFGELADAALLASQRVLPRALSELQFAFQYPALDRALRRALSKGDGGDT